MSCGGAPRRARGSGSCPAAACSCAPSTAAGRLAASPAWLRALLLLESSRNLASISLLGAHLGRLAGSHAYDAVGVVKYLCAGEA